MNEERNGLHSNDRRDADAQKFRDLVREAMKYFKKMLRAIEDVELQDTPLATSESFDLYSEAWHALMQEWYQVVDDFEQDWSPDIRPGMPGIASVMRTWELHFFGVTTSSTFSKQTFVMITYVYLSIYSVTDLRRSSGRIRHAVHTASAVQP